MQSKIKPRSTEDISLSEVLNLALLRFSFLSFSDYLLLTKSPAASADLAIASYKLGSRTQLQTRPTEVIAANLKQIFCNIYEQIRFLISL